ncbi:MAG: hypothetical protein COX48_04950 [bacterium (Candidatus Stahlbacteria) CG23_combo_of_CG06-09_8_20_14_all_34_7]|nr:MAG: hypothetical protein COX48_04950 [bacterium (Candidatus Stahlbacteria) CG23_combo_of_CG06-09_8_20_14_all_34_7]
MFKTLTAAKILIKQNLYEEALEILNDLETKENSQKIMYLKALSYEALNRNEEAEEICYRLIDAKYVEDNVYEILEKLYSKKKHVEDKISESPPESEMALAYELLGDNENALRWYYKKIESLKKKMESAFD